MSRTDTTSARASIHRAALWRLCLRWLAAAGVLLLTGCGASTVVVKGAYPSPAVDKVPLRLGVVYGPNLLDYQYTEYTDMGKEEYHVLSGPTHRELFGAVLPSMFERVVILDNPDSASAAGVDLVFTPAIEEFQLALPQKTRLDSYEVWIKYNMRLSAPDGSYVADWVQTAYGKAPLEGLGSTESGINEATVNALRDLGTNFSLSFTRVPDVRDWLNANL